MRGDDAIRASTGAADVDVLLEAAMHAEPMDGTEPDVLGAGLESTGQSVGSTAEALARFPGQHALVQAFDVDGFEVGLWMKGFADGARISARIEPRPAQAARYLAELAVLLQHGQPGKAGASRVPQAPEVAVDDLEEVAARPLEACLGDGIEELGDVPLNLRRQTEQRRTRTGAARRARAGAGVFSCVISTGTIVSVGTPRLLWPFTGRCSSILSTT